MHHKFWGTIKSARFITVSPSLLQITISRAGLSRIFTLGKFCGTFFVLLFDRIVAGFQSSDMQTFNSISDQNPCVREINGKRFGTQLFWMPAIKILGWPPIISEINIFDNYFMRQLFWMLNQDSQLAWPPIFFGYVSMFSVCSVSIAHTVYNPSSLPFIYLLHSFFLEPKYGYHGWPMSKIWFRKQFWNCLSTSSLCLPFPCIEKAVQDVWNMFI